MYMSILVEFTYSLCDFLVTIAHKTNSFFMNLAKHFAHSLNLFYHNIFTEEVTRKQTVRKLGVQRI